MPDQKTIGKRIGETLEITIDTIRAAAKEMNLTEAQVAKVIEAVLQAQEEQKAKQ